jgi:vacuolar-type H+-ATPase subunit F/Vma7
VSKIVAIGDRHELEGLVLAGVELVPADTASDCVEAWSSLGAHVGLVILSAAAADAIGPQRDERPGVLMAVTP